MIKSMLTRIEKAAGALADRPCDACLPAIIVNESPGKPIYCQRCGKERLVVVIAMDRQVSQALTEQSR